MTVHSAHPPSTAVPSAAAPLSAQKYVQKMQGGVGVVQSSDLLGNQQAIEIEHNGQRYRLQATRSGKLILTK